MQHATPGAKTDDLISISEAARRVKVHKSTLSRQIRDGQIRSHSGKVRLAEVLEDRAANIDLRPIAAGADPVASLHGDATPDATPDASVLVDGRPMPFHAAKAMKEMYLAQLRKLEFEERTGALIDRAAAEAAFFDTARAFRDTLLAWPARVAIEMAEEIRVDPATGKVDFRSLTAVLSAGVHKLVTEMGEPETSEWQAGQ